MLLFANQGLEISSLSFSKKFDKKNFWAVGQNTWKFCNKKKTNNKILAIRIRLVPRFPYIGCKIIAIIYSWRFLIEEYKNNVQFPNWNHNFLAKTIKPKKKTLNFNVNNHFIFCERTSSFIRNWKNEQEGYSIRPTKKHCFQQIKDCNFYVFVGILTFKT